MNYTKRREKEPSSQTDITCTYCFR